GIRDRNVTGVQTCALPICNHTECPGHTAICTDWEMNESYRRWRNEYGDNWESKFRQRYESEMIDKYDTHFYVGTIHGHPHIWIRSEERRVGKESRYVYGRR